MRFLLGLILTIWLGQVALAQDSRSAAIQDTIQGQINAFKVDDFSKAFTFASPMIQNLFGTSENFGSMVRNGYPMVWRPAEVRYLELREISGRLWQKVMIRDQFGTLHFLDYEMVQGPDGWLINGVQTLQPPSVGA
jgi:hypothetical protein